MELLNLLLKNFCDYFKQLDADFEPPEMIMTDFEVPIINSACNIMNTQVKACFLKEDLTETQLP